MAFLARSCASHPTSGVCVCLEETSVDLVLEEMHAEALVLAAAMCGEMTAILCRLLKNSRASRG